MTEISGIESHFNVGAHDDDPEILIVSWHADQALTTGNLGSLSEIMGCEAADEFVKENSLTEFTRKRAARRIGRVAG